MRNEILDELRDLTIRFPAIKDIVEGTGGTTLIEVPACDGKHRLHAKCEWENPFGTVKDRVALALLAPYLLNRKARSSNEILLEYTGGSLGIALSEVCGRIGIEIELVVSEGMAASVQDQLRRKVKLHLAPKSGGFWGVMNKAMQVADSSPQYQLLFQHKNERNLWCHRRWTGAEILSQMKGRTVDHFVASVGSGGTVAGIHAALQAANPRLRTTIVTPDELSYGSHAPPNSKRKYEGSGGLGWSRKQPFIFSVERDFQQRTISYPHAFEGMKEFRRMTGLRIGSSAAANWLVASEIAEHAPANENVVTIFPSRGLAEEWEAIQSG